MAMLAEYALSVGLLLIPVAAWNIALAGQLPPAFQPAVFQHAIPASMVVAENSLRTGVFLLPFLMPLDIGAPGALQALVVYGLGLFVYFASWLALVLRPASAWSHSLPGFVAPACTPAVWLAAMAWLGDRLFWGTFYRWWMYLVLCAAFLLVHVRHTVLVHARCRRAA
jgi:hypothetical protein